MGLIAKALDPLVNLFRRQESFPDVCYDECNAAGLEASFTGLTPALCENGSNFRVLYDQCVLCVRRFTTNSTSEQSNEAVIPDFQRYLDYCETQNNETQLVDVNALLSSWSSHATAQTAIEESLSSAGYNITTTTTSSLNVTSPTTSSPDATATDSRISQANSSSPPNVEVIVPAVVVPVVTVSIGLVIAAFFFLRLRRKRRMALLREGNKGPDYEGKAQLHADSLRPELDGMAVTESELSGTAQLAELPAREPVGSEMDADNVRDSVSDARRRRDTD
ncbi:uncharacterized protein BDV14DRAFT_197330 [Aspergillus stella-maris]|uniref:uncharacterized protein n=1 Tax=Aspergillus stella-maris TaxID=1810926 RepID=UPI003CCCD2EB